MADDAMEVDGDEEHRSHQLFSLASEAVELADLATLNGMLRTECPNLADLTDADGDTLLAVAIRRHARIPMLSFLVHDLGVDVRKANHAGHTLVHALVQSISSVGVICFVLALVPDLVNMRDRAGLAPLHIAVQSLNHGALTQLLRHGADPFAQTESTHLTPLHMAAILDRGPTASELISHARPGSVCPVDITGSSPLFYCRSPELLGIMLRTPVVDWCQRDALGVTPLEKFLSEERRSPHVSRMVRAFSELGRANVLFHRAIASARKHRAKTSLAILHWAKLRAYVRDRVDFPCLASRSACEVDAAFTMLPPEDRVEEGGKRAALARYIFAHCGRGVLANATNDTNLLLQDLCDIPAEFLYPCGTFVFDLREAVRLTVNPYTNTPFPADWIASVRKRSGVLTRLRIYPSADRLALRTSSESSLTILPLSRLACELSDRLLYVNPVFFSSAGRSRIDHVKELILAYLRRRQGASCPTDPLSFVAWVSRALDVFPEIANVVSYIVEERAQMEIDMDSIASAANALDLPFDSAFLERMDGEDCHELARVLNTMHETSGFASTWTDIVPGMGEVGEVPEMNMNPSLRASVVANLASMIEPSAESPATMVRCILVAFAIVNR